VGEKRVPISRSRQFASQDALFFDN